jgi:hypothetical protein
MAVHDESATHLTSADRRSEILADPGFGRYFTDHMIRSDYRDGAWSAIQILPYEPLSFDPSVSCLHYGQLIFDLRPSGSRTSRSQPFGPIATPPVSPGRRSAWPCRPFMMATRSGLGAYPRVHTRICLSARRRACTSVTA